VLGVEDSSDGIFAERSRPPVALDSISFPVQLHSMAVSQSQAHGHQVSFDVVRIDDGIGLALERYALEIFGDGLHVEFSGIGPFPELLWSDVTGGERSVPSSLHGSFPFDFGCFLGEVVHVPL